MGACREQSPGAEAMDKLGKQHVSMAEVTGHMSIGGGTEAGKAGGHQVGRALTAGRGR